jgi:hypothetical protein
MGFFDLISNVVDTVAKPVLAFATGGPSAAVLSVSKPGKPAPILERNEAQMIYTQEGPSTRSFQGPVADQIVSRSTGGFLGNLGQTIGGFGRDVGQFVSDISPLTNLFGIGGGSAAQAPPAAKTIIRQAPDETAMSGEILGANLGLGGALVQGARSFARSPAGQGLIGGAFGAGALALSDGGTGMPRITRRMKADVRKIYMMSGMDPNATAAIMNNLGTYPKFNFNASLVFLILTKRFRNDGPVVTKAAVRKTKTTLRRMKGVVDMYNSVCKPTTRRAPARRAAPKAVQLIKN